MSNSRLYFISNEIKLILQKYIILQKKYMSKYMKSFLLKHQEIVFQF